MTQLQPMLRLYSRAVRSSWAEGWQWRRQRGEERPDCCLTSTKVEAREGQGRQQRWLSGRSMSECRKWCLWMSQGRQVPLGSKGLASSLSSWGGDETGLVSWRAVIQSMEELQFYRLPLRYYWSLIMLLGWWFPSEFHLLSINQPLAHHYKQPMKIDQGSLPLFSLEPSLPSLQPSLPNLFSQDPCFQGANSLKFATLVTFLNRFSALRGVKKGNYARDFVKLLFRHSRAPEFTYPVLRLLLPADDRNRGNYGLKEKNLSKVIADSLSVTKQDYLRLHHYKNPSFQPPGSAIGDFSLVAVDVVENFCRPHSSLTISEVDGMLDELAASSANHLPVFRRLFSGASAEQVKWVVRMVLKDLKVSLKTETVLNSFHPDAADYFNLTNSLLETCRKFVDPSLSLSDEVKIFFPIRPMLAGKKKMGYLKEGEGREYYLETKYDGERLQVHKRGEEVMLFSRNGVDYSKLYHELAGGVGACVEADECVLDGEMVVLERGSGRMAPFGMNKMVALDKETDQFQLVYMVFDLLWLREQDEEINLMKYPLRERKALLEKILAPRPGVLRLVPFEPISQYDDIIRRFSESIDRNEEGIMLKDPSSIYVPKERAGNWIKLKSDYIEGLTDTLDLIILGGYYGDSAARRGDSRHWIDQVTSFLIGVIDRIDGLNPNIAYAVPFAKVGTGYSLDELNRLRARLKDCMVRNEGRGRPQFMECNWKPGLQDRPDCWVTHLSKSVVLEVKAAELIASDSYPTGHTLRFPRIVKIRYDKDWNEAERASVIEELSNKAKYSKHMKRRGDSDSEGEGEGRGREGNEEKAGAAGRKGRERKEGGVYSEFMGYEAEGEPLLSHLLAHFEFCVLQLREGSKQQVERQILLNGGEVVQNPLASTQYIVCDCIDFKVRTYYLEPSRNHTFIRPVYLQHCIQSGAILPLTPLYLMILPEGEQKYYMEHYDRFGDSYTDYLDLRGLDQILDQMTGKHPINSKLVSCVSLKYRRTGKVSLCLGLTGLQEVKLRMHGNEIVHSFDERPNSVVIREEGPTEAERRALEEYLRARPEVRVESVLELEAAKIL